MSLGKSDPPPAPDYAGAAVQTAAGNVDAARIAAKANRVDQNTPYGSINFVPGVNGDPDQWRMDTTLSPLGQQAFDSNQRISAGLGGLAETGLGYVQNTLNSPFNWNNVPKAPVNPGMTGQQAILSRLEPALQRRRDSLDTRLMNQGIPVTSDAYKTEQNLAGQNENDLYQQAALQGINLDTAARATGIQEQSFARNEPLNMLNAVRSGSQTQLPQFQQVPQQATTAGPNYLGAAQMQGADATSQYNAQQAQQAQLIGTLGQVGGAAMMGGFNPFSLGGGAMSKPYSFSQFDNLYRGM